MERLNRDKKFAKCFEGVDSLDSMLGIAGYWGYDFTQEDLKHAFVTLSNMSEEELAGASGGVPYPYWGVLREMLAPGVA